MYHLIFLLEGEIAYLKPDASKQINLKGETTIYVDDFEGSCQSNIDNTITFGLFICNTRKWK
jgi:hypothetical protein